MTATSNPKGPVIMQLSLFDGFEMPILVTISNNLEEERR
jgi:hypothetical protein